MPDEQTDEVRERYYRILKYADDYETEAGQCEERAAYCRESAAELRKAATTMIPSDGSGSWSPPGFYWVRMFDAIERQSYWTVKERDDNGWDSLGTEVKKKAPGARGRDLIGPIPEPTEEGLAVETWAERQLGFYWMRWRQSQTQYAYWSITEFIGCGWRVMGSDELWTDNDMRDHPVVGPIFLPRMNYVA